MSWLHTFGFISVGKIAAGFLMIRIERLEKPALALKKSSRIYLCNFSFAFGLRNWLLKKSSRIICMHACVIFFVSPLVCEIDC